jgi:glyoxylase-like metal-dependent hydrolase (beta-lactamase superfamily II)
LTPIALHALNPGPITGAGNWTWLLPGRVPTLIDAGVGDPRHLDALEQALGRVPLVQVLVTHGHSDHASGAAAIAARMPHVQFAKMPWPEQDDRWPVPWRPIEDGQFLQAGDSSLVAIHTPGHAPDHLCFWHEDTRTLFCADLAMEGSTIWIPVGLQGDLTDYLSSLERVLDLQPARMLPAHGPVIEDPGRLLRASLAHRREREEQVVDALRRGYTSLDGMVTRIYGPVGEAIARLARDSVTAHLVKLQREGRVRRNADTWHMIGP